MESTLLYEGPRRLKANQLFRATLRARLCRSVTQGGRIVMAVRHFSDLGIAQATDPAAENYITVESDAAAAVLHLREWESWPRHPWNMGIELELVSGELAAGNTVTVALGAGDSPGYRCQSFAEEMTYFRLGIDADGSGRWQVAPREGTAAFEVVGGRPVRLRCIVTDATGDGEATVIVKGEDSWGNVAGEPPGEVALLVDGAKPLARTTLEPGRTAVLRMKAPRDGEWHTITAATDDGAFQSRSNPFGPAPLEGYRLYFGEIHSQSGLCDGTNPPATLYHYAREGAGLDFAAVTSHDVHLTADAWDEIKRAAREAHRPGEFVTFLGYEWTGTTALGGDHNVYFPGDEGQLVYSRRYTNLPEWDASEGQAGPTRTMTETIAELGPEVMVIPHCGGRQCNLDYHDPAVMPLIEMHSCHRNYEHVAAEALARGLRMGFIGGSDDHIGRPGDSAPSARDKWFSCRSGLVAAYAKGLDRQSLWEAFFAKRVYATNGARIVLDFRINAVLMGGVVKSRGGEELAISFTTRLDGLFDRAELVRGGELLRTFRGDGNRLEAFEGSFDEKALPGATPYYVKVFQTDGGAAWSSPIWVEA